MAFLRRVVTDWLAIHAILVYPDIVLLYARLP